MSGSQWDLNCPLRWHLGIGRVFPAPVLTFGGGRGEGGVLGVLECAGKNTQRRFICDLDPYSRAYKFFLYIHCL